MAALQWAGVSMSICQTPWRTRRVFLLACRYASIGLIVPLWVAATNGADATDGMLSEDLPTYALVICLALIVWLNVLVIHLQLHSNSKKVVAERSAAGVTTADASVAARETAAQHVGNNARSVPLEVADEPFTCS